MVVASFSLRKIIVGSRKVLGSLINAFTYLLIHTFTYIRSSCISAKGARLPRAGTVSGMYATSSKKFPLPQKWRPLKNDFVAAKQIFASDDNRAELTLCSYKNRGFSAVSTNGLKVIAELKLTI